MDHNILGQCSNTEFLTEYWQLKPLLIRQAIKDFQTDLNAEILAGLALEDNVRSRLIRYQETNPVWDCQYGSFKESDFTALPASSWTLLVQDIDKHLPEYAHILDYFSFLPRWRIDDLMVSYAVDGGSAGPHTDHYDVFLLQAAGQRQWQIQTIDVNENDLLPDTSLQILDNFHPQQEWILDPGDMLYLPAGVAHHGIAIGDCMTFSIGFRAPSQAEILQMYTEQFSHNDGVSRNFRDKSGLANRRRGELDKTSLNTFRELLRESIDDDTLLMKSIAMQLTERTDTYSFYETEDYTLETFSNCLSTINSIVLHPAVRSLYIKDEECVHWFVNSTHYHAYNQCENSIKHLTDEYKLMAEHIQPLLSDNALLQALYDLYLAGEIKLVH